MKRYLELDAKQAKVLSGVLDCAIMEVRIDIAREGVDEFSDLWLKYDTLLGMSISLGSLLEGFDLEYFKNETDDPSEV